MTRHFATALLIGVGFVPDLASPGAEAASSRADAARVPLQGAVPSARIRRPVFDNLQFGGRCRPDQIAQFAYEEGRLWAEWSGQIQVPEPSWLETSELDAEWMACAPQPSDGEGRWMLARRDLQPAEDGQFWSVLVYGSLRHQDTLQMIVTVDAPLAVARQGSFGVSFVQGAGSLRLTIRPRESGVGGEPIELAAPSLHALMERYPEHLRSRFAPAVRKIARIELL